MPNSDCEMWIDYSSSDSTVPNAESSICVSPAKIVSFLAPKPVKVQDNPPEMDLKPFIFEDLIDKLDAKKLLEYLQLVVNFLKSSDEEMELFDISKELEEVLVHIVKDVEVLRSPRIYSTCAKVSNQIIEMVKSKVENKDFMLVSIYKKDPRYPFLEGLGVKFDNVLVYKKLYYNTMTEKNPLMSLPPGSNDSSLSSTLQSRSTSVDFLDSQRSLITPPTETHFKSHCLNLILQFIKDDTRPILKFSGLTSQEAKYVYNVFSRVRNQKFDGSLGDKKACAAIREAVKIFALKYAFRIRYSIRSRDKKSLLLEKIRKKEDNKVPLADKTNAQKRKTPSPPLSSKLKRSVLKQKDFLSKVPSDFIDYSLEKLVKFFSDETEARIIFQITCKDKKTFLFNAIDFSRSSLIKDFFSDNQKELLDKLMVLVDNKTGYKVRIKEKKSPCGERNVIFTKVPIFGETVQKKRACKKAERKAKSKTAREAARGKSGQIIKFKPGGNLDERVSNEKSNVYEPAQVDAMCEYDKDIMYFEGPMLMFPAPSLESRSRCRTRRDQLIEALSVPVKSEKATRMMVGMGWKGGALGSRAQGITEPIMPNLTATSDIFQVTCSVTITHLDRIFEVAEILRLIASLEYNDLKSTVQLLEDQELVDQVLAEYRRDQELVVIGLMTDDMKQVTLTKCHSDALPLRINVKSKRNEDVLNLALTNNINLLVSLCGAFCQTKTSFNATKFRINVLIEIFNFAKDTIKTVFNMNFTTTLTKKQKEFLEKTIQTINEQKRYGVTFPEAILGVEIRRLTGQYNLRVEFVPENKSIIITKEFKHKYGKPVTTSNHTAPHFTYETTIINNGAKENDETKKKLKITNKDLNETNQETNEDDDGNIDDDEDNHFDNRKDCDLVYKEINEDDITTEEDNNQITEHHNENDHPSNETIPDPVTPEADNILGPVTPKTDTILDAVIPEANNISDSATPEADNIPDPVTPEADNIPDPVTPEADNIPQPVTAEVDNIPDVVTPETDNTFEDSESISKANCPKRMKMMNGHDKAMSSLRSINNDSTDEDNDFDTDSMYDYGSAMSASDQSAYTLNLDYSETEDIEDISMLDSISNDGTNGENMPSKLIYDNDLDLRLKTITMLNIDLKNKSKNFKKPKIDVKFVYLTKNYFLSKEFPIYIQGLISMSIDRTKELPLLKCHGVQNGALVYSCHTKYTLDWLQNICVANNITLTHKEFDKMSLKINSYFKFDDDYFFNMLEMYNQDISTKEWSVLKKEVFDDYVLLELTMDKKSFQYIVDSDLALYAGVDKVTFSIIWE